MTVRLAERIEHTLLSADATYAAVHRLCEEAVRYGFAAVCVHGGHVARCRINLGSAGVERVAVAGFPLGASSTRAKVCEAEAAVRDGADQIDMVMNLGALKSGDAKRVEQDIRAVVDAVAPAPVKVILETALLADAQKRRACALAEAGGAVYVKTSTGFGPGGATVGDVRLLRSAVSPRLGVKASGGIRDRETACAMVEAGASRLGTSRSVAIVGGDRGEPEGRHET